MMYDENAIAAFERRYRANFINSLDGFKSLVLIGTKNSDVKIMVCLANEEQLELSTAIASILEQDQEGVITAIADARSEESDGNYFIEYSIYHPQDPNGRLMQARGKMFYDTLICTLPQGHGNRVMEGI